jgi:hypothetical protein
MVDDRRRVALSIINLGNLGILSELLQQKLGYRDEV